MSICEHVILTKTRDRNEALLMSMTADGLYTPPHAKQTDDWLYSALLTCGATDTPRRAGGKLECAAVGTGSVNSTHNYGLQPPIPLHPPPLPRVYRESKGVTRDSLSNPVLLTNSLCFCKRKSTLFVLSSRARIFKHGFFLQFFSFPSDGEHAAICLACHKFISSYTIRIFIV
jgi:hypothetical protein